MTQASTTRRKLRLTQAEFARLMMVDQGTVSRWEHGICAPNGPAVQLMALFLTLPPAQIAGMMGGTETTTTNQENT